MTLAEFQTYRPPAARDDPGSAPAPVAVDWRTDAVTQLAVRKTLVREASADDPALAPQLREARSSILRQAMADELGWPRIRPTEEESRREFESHLDQYRHPDRIRLQHIFLRAERHAMPQPERDAVRDRLEAIRDEILAGAEFTGMARLHSQSADAESGGWMMISAGQNIDEGFAREAWSLELGQVSQVIETPTGYQIAELKEKLPGNLPTYEEVADFARRRAASRKLDDAQAEFVAEAGSRHGLVRSYERLEDRNIADETELIRIGDFRFPFAELKNQLPEAVQLELFNRLFERPRAFLDQVARNELLQREAERLGLADRADVAAQIALAEENVRAAFALSRRLDRLAAEVPVEKLREFFSQNEARFRTLRTMDLRVFFVAANDKEPLWGTLRRAEALERRIRDGEEFGALARQYSDHYSAPQGGLIENLTDYGLGRWVQSRALFRRALSRLQPGEMTKAMIAECYDQQHLSFRQTGAIFVRLEREHPPRMRSFEESLSLVRDSYVRRHYSELTAAVRDAVSAEIGLRILDDRLPAL
ncbi:MAG: peptidylprolyl isomerase [Thermoanaerobaculia bacterium]